MRRPVLGREPEAAAAELPAAAIMFTQMAMRSPTPLEWMREFWRYVAGV